MILQRLAILAAAALVLAGCEPGPRPIDYGQAECAHCRMRVMEPAFGSQLVTRQGRHFDFDSIECLSAYLARENVPLEDVHSSWVPDFHTHAFAPAGEAFFLHSEGRPSPMGLSLSAYADEAAAREALQNAGGRLLTWEEVDAVVAEAWSR
jgi:copper chaperone NosL